MGRAKITAVHTSGDYKTYDIELTLDPAKSVLQLHVIDDKLATLNSTNIPQAEAAVTTAESALSAAWTALNAAISAKADTTEKQVAVVTAIKNLATKRLNLSGFMNLKTKLLKQKTLLENSMLTQEVTDVWCVDRTNQNTLAVGNAVGTIEINGDSQTFYLTPGGSLSSARGKLQPAGVSTGAAVFVNRARFPAWQKWKPTYRIGCISAIDSATGKCDVVIPAQRSREQAIPINQSGEVAVVSQPEVEGWADFAERNPTFPLVTETGDSQITASQQLLDDLYSVQHTVNDRTTYQRDEQTYAKLEYWTIMNEGGRGDCEDYALTKAKMLLDLGYPASAIKMEVGTAPGGEGHAWLIIQTSEGDIALDNNTDDPIEASLLPYYDRQRQTGLDWNAFGVKLSNVSIEYMSNMNELVFTVSDMVVVEFTDYDWSKPKVIGFESEPWETKVLFYIGPDSNPFSEYDRETVDPQLVRYYSCYAAGRLDPLACAAVTLLILPCPVRSLTSDELDKITTFRNRGGRVAFFCGTDLTSANAVLGQLGSKLFMFPPCTSATGYMIYSGVYWNGANIPLSLVGMDRGYIGVLEANWSEAEFIDFAGFGLRYNNITNMFPTGHYIMYENASPPWPSLYCSQLKDELVAYFAARPSPDTFTLPSWTEQSWGGHHIYPDGYLPAGYDLNLEELKDWLLTITSKMPFAYISAYGAVPTITNIPFGYYYDYTTAHSRNNFEHHGSRLAYASGENLVVCGFTPSWFDGGVTTDRQYLDAFMGTFIFSQWLINDDLTQRDLFGRGFNFANIQPFWPGYIKDGAPYGGVTMMYY